MRTFCQRAIILEIRFLKNSYTVFICGRDSICFFESFVSFLLVFFLSSFVEQRCVETGFHSGVAGGGKSRRGKTLVSENRTCLRLHENLSPFESKNHSHY